MVVIEVKLPRAWEDGIDLALARMRRCRRCARINMVRKMAILRENIRDWVESLQREDERPIIRRGEI